MTPQEIKLLREKWSDFIGNRRISNNAVADFFISEFSSLMEKREIKKIEKLPQGQRQMREKFSDDAFTIQDKIDEIVDALNTLLSPTNNLKD